MPLCDIFAGGGGCPVIENAYHTSIRLCVDRPPESLPEFHLHAWYHNSLDIVLEAKIPLLLCFTE